MSIRENAEEKNECYWTDEHLSKVRVEHCSEMIYIDIKAKKYPYTLTGLQEEALDIYRLRTHLALYGIPIEGFMEQNINKVCFYDKIIVDGHYIERVLHALNKEKPDRASGRTPELTDHFRRRKELSEKISLAFYKQMQRKSKKQDYWLALRHPIRYLQSICRSHPENP
jgi:hypothetical protein